MPKKSYRVSYIEGDGIGPEIFASARSVLSVLGETCGLDFDWIAAPAGDRVKRELGTALPQDSIELIKQSEVCLKAPVGETALETIIFLRQELNLFANIRPAKSYPFVESKYSNVDLVIVRENTEDLYVSKEHEELEGKRAVALKITTEEASTRIAKVAFELALERRAARSPEERASKNASVVCVQKSNVLPKTDGLFLRSCESVSREFPSVKFSSMYVDTAAMNLVRIPENFDVIVTSNMYGDILSDEASQIVGGLGVAASGNIGSKFAIFEPVHGCAPDIAGKGIANPLSILFTVRMMLDWLGSEKKDDGCIRASSLLEHAVSAVTGSNIKTPDIGGSSGTKDVTRAICSEIRNASNADRYKETVEMKRRA